MLVVGRSAGVFVLALIILLVGKEAGPRFMENLTPLFTLHLRISP
jgi:hypothetical protein